MTALHWAVRADDAETAQLLIRAGANVKAANRYGITPLTWRPRTASRDPGILLEGRRRSERDGPEGETVLMTAARTGNPDVVRALIARGANVNAGEAWQGQTALMWAASQNNAAAVKALIELGADKEARSKLLAFPEFVRDHRDGGLPAAEGGWTPLMYAAREGAIDAAAALADLKVDLNADDSGRHDRAAAGHHQCPLRSGRLLIEKGADPNVADSTGMTALYSAVDMRTRADADPAGAQAGRQDRCARTGEGLLAHGANPNVRLKRPIIGRHQNLVGDASLGEGATPLARARKAHDLPVMRLLFDAGADATLTLKDRTTVAMIAPAGGARAEGARGRQAARRARRRRQRVQRERSDDPAQRRRSWGQRS